MKKSELQQIIKEEIDKALNENRGLPKVGDKVLDAGGLLREWLLLLFKELTNQNLGLFTLAETKIYVID